MSHSFGPKRADQQELPGYGTVNFGLSTMLTTAVIISAKCSGQWLEQCLVAVARQRLPRNWRLRILLGIDACPSTFEVAKSLRLPNLAVAYFPVHVGPYVVFNTLAYSDHFDAYIRFDADDVMLEDYLNAQLKLLDSALSPVIIQTWSIYVDPQLRPVSAPLAGGSRTQSDGRRAGTSDGQFLFTRAVWNRLGGFQAWCCHADTEFIRRASWCGVVRHVIPRYLYLRRVHPTSLTQSTETGYRSSIRRYYSQQIAVAHERYASGLQPECLRPAASGYYLCTP